jgi:hypothetical protein
LVHKYFGLVPALGRVFGAILVVLEGAGLMDDTMFLPAMAARFSSYAQMPAMR